MSAKLTRKFLALIILFGTGNVIYISILVGEEPPLVAMETAGYITELMSFAPKQQIQQHLVAGLSCESRGNSSIEAVNELVYWKDIKDDARWVSPFRDAGPSEKFLTFEPDEGGWNNIRMAMETAVLTAILTGRTLVMPPDHKLPWRWLQKAAHKNQFGFSDFFHFDSVKAEHVGLNVISFQTFLETQVMTGKLKNNNTNLPIDFPPNNRTDWNGRLTNHQSARHGEGKVLWSWLRRNVPSLDWDYSKCVAAFPSEPGPEGVARLNQGLKDVRARAIADQQQHPKKYSKRPRKWKVRHEGYQGRPTPVNASMTDRLEEDSGGP